MHHFVEFCSKAGLVYFSYFSKWSSLLLYKCWLTSVIRRELVCSSWNGRGAVAQSVELPSKGTILVQLYRWFESRLRHKVVGNF